MVELSSKRVEQILHEETPKTEGLETILRAIYTRYMHLYERYFADIDALNDDLIAELNEYHDETKSLVKYYYMDIPLDICIGIKEFEKKYSARLLGPDWHELLFDCYEDFRDDSAGEYESEKALKAAFAKQNLEAFYEAMDSVFRDGFGTGSQTAEKLVSGLAGLIFGE